MPQKTCIIYHKDCNDGFGAAWAAYVHLGNKDTQFIAQTYGDKPPEIEPGSQVYILDFSYPLETMLELTKAHPGRVQLIDHHETAQRNLLGKVPGCHIDPSHSGAYLAWQWWSGEDEVPLLIQYIEDRDLWKWEMRHSREISAGLDSQPKNLEHWTRISGYPTQSPSKSEKTAMATLAAQGQAITRNNQQQVERIVQYALEKEIAGHLVPVVNTPVLASEACEALLEKHQEAPFAAAWYEREGQRKWSLRARPGFEVDRVAEQMGGGGHPHAAGFTESL